MFKVFVKIWDNDGYDYMVHENSGLVWEKEDDAQRELKEALEDELDAWIEEYDGMEEVVKRNND